jgi:predicted methyltransferase
MTHAGLFRLCAAFMASCLLLLLSSSLQAEQQASDEKTTTALKAILAGSHRPAADSARDQYRHPLETLTWFGVKDNMTVVEVWPGGGWYTDILAPLLKEHGTYYAAGADPESEGAKKFKEKLATNPDLFGKVKVTMLSAPEKVEIAPAGSADMVLTFRNTHNWMASGQAENVFKAMYTALKPGGVLGVVEHRANSTLECY